SPGQPSGRSAPGGAHPPSVSVRLPSGALVGIAVAVMVAAAITLAAIQRRRRYRPRPGPPSTLAPETPPLPEVIRSLRRAPRPPAPAAGPEAGTQDAALATGPDIEDPSAADPYADLYDSLPAPGADHPIAAPVTEPDSMPQPQAGHPARRELPPGTVAVGVR